MAKSYRLCRVQEFHKEDIGWEKYEFGKQYPIPEVDSGPRTSILKSLSPIIVEDYETYSIDHQYIVKMPARFDGHWFNEFVTRGSISSYVSPSENLMLLQGTRDHIDNFCKDNGESDLLKLALFEIDMKALQQKLPEVTLVWFHYPQGRVRASAIMGNHLEQTREFKAGSSAGEISTLSFYLEYTDGTDHPIMVTQDAAIVLQRNYKNVAEEVAFVNYCYTILLKDICREIPVKLRKPKGLSASGG